MKRYLLFLLVLTNCLNENNQAIINKADSFIKNSATGFLKNKELMNYRYEPRGQFYFKDSDYNQFRIMTSEKSLKLYCFSDSCLLDKKVGIKTPKYLTKGFYDIKNDTIRLHFNKDSIIDTKSKFENEPLEIFKKHKTDLRKLGIYSYSAHPSINRYYVYLNSTFVLIKSNKIESLISEKDKLIKNYKNNWYLIKLSTPNEY